MMLLLLLILTATPLSEAQRAALAQTTDRTGVEEAGLYALAAHALTGTPTDAAHAPALDPATLYAEPAVHRGEVFAVEGRCLRVRSFGLARRGDWGDAVTELAVGIEGVKEAAVVFLVDPSAFTPPRVGDRVRVTGRFYKVWADTDQRGNPADYLVFVAPADGLTTLAHDGGLARTQAMAVALLLLILFGGPLLILLRRAAVRPLPPRRQPAPLPDTIDTLPAPPLPPDPADALAQLDQRHTHGN